MDRPLRRARDSYTEQVQIIMPQHVNGAQRLFGGQRGSTWRGSTWPPASAVAARGAHRGGVGVERDHGLSGAGWTTGGTGLALETEEERAESGSLRGAVHADVLSPSGVRSGRHGGGSFALAARRAKAPKSSPLDGGFEEPAWRCAFCGYPGGSRLRRAPQRPLRHPRRRAPVNRAFLARGWKAAAESAGDGAGGGKAPALDENHAPPSRLPHPRRVPHGRHQALAGVACGAASTSSERRQERAAATSWAYWTAASSPPCPAGSSGRTLRAPGERRAVLALSGPAGGGGGLTPSSSPRFAPRLSDPENAVLQSPGARGGGPACQTAWSSACPPHRLRSRPESGKASLYDSRAVTERFLRACLGWVRYKPRA